ncbi:hypothetical protein PILCRDRAFT_9618 [Piloderma croceum F 1598]|uniref:Uncharacterized protein n=1 Tax=Piloderma croceum (strain F 1598) TaxID=765440 RepID=A0A0C3B2J7_PILCF|nr:hypothetical protein PILCRDRAFT_9618 [Piloderma croceum F 1598]
MATQATTLSHTTRNSRNAETTPGIAFRTHIPSQPTPKTKKRNSDKTADDDTPDGMDSIPGDDDFGDDGTRNDTPDDPEDPEDPDDEPPDNNPDDDDDDMQNNLAHAIAALARNVQRQGDGPHSKVQGHESVTFYAWNGSTILDAWAQIACWQFLASQRIIRLGQPPFQRYGPTCI